MDRIGELPPDVMKLRLSLANVVMADRPRPALSRSFCRLREANPKLFKNVIDWLGQPEVVQDFSNVGAHWAWVKLADAFAKINDGGKPHIAFGMDVGGRPPLWEFTSVEDAYIFALYLNINCNWSIAEARGWVEQLFSVDIRDIARVEPVTADLTELNRHAEAIAAKYKFSDDEKRRADLVGLGGKNSA